MSGGSGSTRVKDGAENWAAVFETCERIRTTADELGLTPIDALAVRWALVQRARLIDVLRDYQSGKTTGFAIPAILEWQGPVLATSIKSDLLNDTYAARSTIPDADFLIYDPTHSTGYATAGWTPLAACETWQGAQRVASWLVDAARATSAGICFGGRSVSCAGNSDRVPSRGSASRRA